MTIIDDYLNDIRRNLSHLGLRERQAVLAEIEDHLRTETKRLRKEDKGLSADEAALQATHAFGDPKEIGVAYGAHGGVINRSTGELLLDVAILSTRAAGRSIRGVLKWTGIIAATALGAALLVILTALAFSGPLVEAFKDDIVESQVYHAYGKDHQVVGTLGPSGIEEDKFGLPSDLKEFQFRWTVDPNGGCAAIRLISPSGEQHALNGQGCDVSSGSVTFFEPGTWTVEYTYVLFTGTLSTDAYYYRSARTNS